MNTLPLQLVQVYWLDRCAERGCLAAVETEEASVQFHEHAFRHHRLGLSGLCTHMACASLGHTGGLVLLCASNRMRVYVCVCLRAPYVCSSVYAFFDVFDCILYVFI